MKLADVTRRLSSVFLVLLSGLVLVNCANTGATSQTVREPVVASGPVRGVPQDPILQSGKKKGGSQLWSENCARCHNMRSPSIYSDDQWDVSVEHMRVRAGLTANEARKITAFLKASN